MIWSVELSGIPEIVKLISRIILEILEIGYAFRRLSNIEKIEIRINLNKLENELNSSRTS